MEHMTDQEKSVHECIKAIAERWDGPFEKPITFDRETGALMAERWAIKVYKKTKAGNISRNGGGYLFVDYCPLCGEKLK